LFLEEARLKELFERLGIKYSQHAIWKEYAELIGALLGQSVKQPSDDEDINANSRNVIENEFFRQLAKISNSTSKLQAVLTEDEQKILHLLNFEWVKLHCRKKMQR
jgi:hypothetical protein